MDNSFSIKKLTQLLEIKPKILIDEQTGIYNFESLVEGLLFSFYISVHERTACIYLGRPSGSKPLYSIRLKIINRLKLTSKKLVISDPLNKYHVELFIKPSMSLYTHVNLRDNMIIEDSIELGRFGRYNLIELFGTLPQVIDEQAETYSYKSDENEGLRQILTFSQQENWAQLKLKYSESEKPIYDIKFEPVTAIEANPEKGYFTISLLESGIKKTVKCTLKPSFSFSLSLPDIENADKAQLMPTVAKAWCEIVQDRLQKMSD